MGYCTYYTLTYTDEPQEAIEDAKATLDRGYDPFENGEIRWYEHEAEMRELSKQFPEVLFELHGEGEQNDDMWYKYFKNGKMQTCSVIIDFPPFDEKKLK